MVQNLLDWVKRPYGIVTGCALCTGIVVGTVDDLRQWAVDRAMGILSSPVSDQQACVDDYFASQPASISGTYLIVLTDLANDAGLVQTKAVDQTLRNMFGLDPDGAVQFEAIPCTIYSASGNAARRSETAQETTRSIAASTSADVVIWGEVTQAGAQIDLALTYAVDRAIGSYQVSQSSLGTDFGPAVGSLLATKILMIAAPKDEADGSSLVERMTRIVDLTTPLITSPPADMTLDQRVDAIVAHCQALYIMGQQSGDAELLLRAADALQTALGQVSPDQDRDDWVKVQLALAQVMAALGDVRSGTADLEAAADAYRRTLAVWLPTDKPQDWAGVQTELGNVLYGLGQRLENPDFLVQAIVAFQQALLFQTQADRPQDWAITQTSLANTLTMLAQYEDGTRLLTEAVTAHTDALKENRRDAAPMNWAANQHGLGDALLEMGRRSEGDESTSAFKDARHAFEAALQVRNRDVVPVDWAMSTFSLAKLDWVDFQTTGDTGTLVSAREQATQARDVFWTLGPTGLVVAADALLAELDAAGG